MRLRLTYVSDASTDYEYPVAWCKVARSRILNLSLELVFGWLSKIFAMVPCSKYCNFRKTLNCFVKFCF